MASSEAGCGVIRAGGPKRCSTARRIAFSRSGDSTCVPGIVRQAAGMIDQSSLQRRVVGHAPSISHVLGAVKPRPGDRPAPSVVARPAQRPTPIRRMTDSECETDVL